MTACGWFWGSHGCDGEEGHASLPTEDGGRCAHRCGRLDERAEDGTLCCEIRRVADTAGWEIRHWYPASDTEPGEWGRWAAVGGTYAAPFRMDALGDGEHG